jgi:signal transduction histidine kinase
MGLKKAFDRLPLFWKIYIVIALFLIFIGLILENLVMIILLAVYGKFLPWHENIIWLVNIFLPATVGGYFLSRHVSRRLENMAAISKTMAQGNFSARLPVINNDNDAFDKLSRKFNQMADAIDRQLQSERRLLFDLSHELCSPLTRMTLAVELLSSQENASKNSRTLHSLEREIIGMSELVEQLLSQSPDHAGKDMPQEEIDLSRMLIELARDFSFQGSSSGKSVTCLVPGGLKIKGNEMLLRRMAGNIIANAVFYTRDKSGVLLSSVLHEDRIEIAVRDFGPGVPEENLEDIFRVFYRIDHSRSRLGGGTGLGLALAREAAFFHGGSISARNVSPGLEVTATLPLSRKDSASHPL